MLVSLQLLNNAKIALARSQFASSGICSFLLLALLKGVLCALKGNTDKLSSLLLLLLLFLLTYKRLFTHRYLLQEHTL